MSRFWLSVLIALTLILGAAAVQAAAPKTPVEFTFLGLSPDKKLNRYEIKILTDKPISQVDFNLKFFNQEGNALLDDTVIWQNIVKSVRQPIEAGKTYQVDDDFVKDGAVRSQGKLLRVWFKDSSRWEAPK